MRNAQTEQSPVSFNGQRSWRRIIALGAEEVVEFKFTSLQNWNAKRVFPSQPPSPPPAKKPITASKQAGKQQQEKAVSTKYAINFSLKSRPKAQVVLTHPHHSAVPRSDSQK